MAFHGKTIQKMTEDEMQELADKLIGMKFKKAMRHARNLDPQVHLEQCRVGRANEIQTCYRLPNLGVRVTLVEEADRIEKGGNSDKFKARPRFVEARVEPLA